MKPLTGPHSKGTRLAVVAKIRLGCKWHVGTNTPAYCETELFKMEKIIVDASRSTFQLKFCFLIGSKFQ